MKRAALLIGFSCVALAVATVYRSTMATANALIPSPVTGAPVDVGGLRAFRYVPALPWPGNPSRDRARWADALPPTLDCRGECGPVMEQEGDGLCACYALSAYASAVYWRRTGEMIHFPPKELFRAMAERARGRHKVPPSGENAWCSDCALRAVADAFGMRGEVVTIRAGRGQINVDAVKRAIVENGVVLCDMPVVCGWAELRNNAAFTLSADCCRDVIDSHVSVLCGWTRDGFIIQNSWGKTWGARGFGVIPFALFVETAERVDYFKEQE